MYIAVSAIAYLIEFFIGLSFFNDLFSGKIKDKHRHFVGAFLYTVAFFIFILFENTNLNTTTFLIVNFIFALKCYKSRIVKALLSSLFMTAIMNATEFLSMCILSAANNGDINSYISSTPTYTIGIIFSKTLYFIFAKLTITLGFNFSKREKTKNPGFLFLFPICSLIILYTFWMIASRYKLSNEIEFIISISGIAIMCAIILTYIFYGKTSKELDELYKAQSAAERVNTDTTYYAILDKQNNLLKTFIHDEKNHLTVIKSIANNSVVNEYIDKVYGQIEYYSMFGNTKNKILDLIINKYQYICKNENIDFSTSIITANLSYMEQSDLITLLSNIHDNAVEAARKSSEKIIDLSINKVNGFDILTCLNSCAQKPQVIGKNLKSTKNDSGFHGLGIKSIQNTVKKYHGEFEWSFNEIRNEFTVHIAFNTTSKS